MIAQTDHIANSDSWQPLADIPWQHSGLIVENRGSVPVMVYLGSAGDPEEDESDLILAPGAFVTLPHTRQHHGTFVWARASDDGAQLTHYAQR